MQRLEVSGAVRPIYGSLSVKRLNRKHGVMLYRLQVTEKRKIIYCRQDSSPEPSTIPAELPRPP